MSFTMNDFELNREDANEMNINFDEYLDNSNAAEVYRDSDDDLNPNQNSDNNHTSSEDSDDNNHTSEDSDDSEKSSSNSDDDEKSSSDSDNIEKSSSDSDDDENPFQHSDDDREDDHKFDHVDDDDHISDHDRDEEQDSHNDNDDNDDSHENKDDKDDFPNDRVNMSVQTTQGVTWNLKTSTIEELCDLWDNGLINVSPEYQRKVVWHEGLMSSLIKALMMREYVAPMIFNAVEQTADENGVVNIQRNCIDGKQRLTTITRFVKGEFGVMIDGKKNYFCDPNADDRRQRRLLLSTAMKQDFLNTRILHTDYLNQPIDRQIDTFTRVQHGKTLTVAESFRATQGPWQDLAREFEDKYSDVVKLSKHDRYAGFLSIMSVFSQLWELEDYRRNDSHLDRELADRLPLMTNVSALRNHCGRRCTEGWRNLCRRVFDRFQQLCQEEKSVFEDQGYMATKTFSPMEFIGVGCLIRLNRKKSNNQLRTKITELRALLRAENDAIRKNKANWASVRRYLFPVAFSSTHEAQDEVDESGDPSVPPEETMARRPGSQNDDLTASLANECVREIPQKNDVPNATASTEQLDGPPDTSWRPNFYPGIFPPDRIPQTSQIRREIITIRVPELASSQKRPADDVDPSSSVGPRAKKPRTDTGNE